MSEEYLRFKLFPDKQTAEDFAEVLKQNNIDYKIEEDSLVFDASFANHPLARDYVIAVKQTDFKNASTAYDEYFAKQLNDVPTDYYLLQFSDDELLDIMAKPDEWGAFDYQLATALLKKRGIDINKEKADRLKADRYYELARPEGEGSYKYCGLLHRFYFLLPCWMDHWMDMGLFKETTAGWLQGLCL